MEFCTLTYIFLQLPDSVCSFQEVNYEVFILDNNGALALPASQSKQHVGPGRVVDYIPVPGLAEGQNYTARMEISSAAGNLTRELLFSNGEVTLI